MKKILLYLVLLVSVAVFAQQQLFNLQDPSEAGAGNTQEPATATDDASVDSEAAADNDTSGDSQDSGLTGDESARDGDEPGPGAVNTDEAQDPEQPESDFEPTEEISEDYPVPLPSDI